MPWQIIAIMTEAPMSLYVKPLGHSKGHNYESEIKAIKYAYCLLHHGEEKASRRIIGLTEAFSHVPKSFINKENAPIGV